MSTTSSSTLSGDTVPSLLLKPYNMAPPLHFNTPHDLLRAAGCGSSLVYATIPSNNRQVLIKYTDKKDHCRYYSDTILLATPNLLDRWLDANGGFCRADKPLPQTPMITVSRAFSLESPAPTRYGLDARFVYIVRGISGTAKSKVIVTADLMSAALGMIHEASNGYSVVMSGVVYRRTVEALFGTPGRASAEMHFVRVDSCRALVKKTNASLRFDTLSQPRVNLDDAWLGALYIYF